MKPPLPGDQYVLENERILVHAVTETAVTFSREFTVPLKQFNEMSELSLKRGAKLVREQQEEEFEV